MTEPVTWRSASAEPPDSKRTVLVRSRREGDRRVLMGWYEDGSWFGVDATEYVRGAIVAWAEIPQGPA